MSKLTTSLQQQLLLLLLVSSNFHSKDPLKSYYSSAQIESFLFVILLYLIFSYSFLLIGTEHINFNAHRFRRNCCLVLIRFGSNSLESCRILKNFGTKGKEQELNMESAIESGCALCWLLSGENKEKGHKWNS